MIVKIDIMRTFAVFCFSFSFACMLYSVCSAQEAEDKKIILDIEYLIKMHEKKPESVEYIVEIARKYKERKDYENAVLWFKKAEKLDSKNTDVLFEIGVLLSWMGKYEESIGYFKSILNIVPYHLDAMVAMARVLSWQDKHKEALALCESVIRDDPKYLDAYLLKARILTWNSRFDEARTAYKKVQEYDPDDVQAKRGLVALNAASGDYDKAIREYKNILEEEPGNHDITRELGRVLSWKGEYDRGIFYLKKAIELAPEDRSAAEALTRVYRWSGKYEEGIEFQKSILEKNKMDAGAVFEIALLYDMQGKYDDAVQWYEKAASMDKDNPQINARLGLLYSRSDRIDDAINSLQKTLKAQENDVDSLILLGRVYSWKKRIDESIKLYKEAIKAEPDNEDAYIGLGRTYFYDDNWRMAEIQFKKALEVNPLNREALGELEKIQSLRLPDFTTRYDFFSFRNYDGSRRGYAERVVHREVSQAVKYAYSADLSAEVQYKSILENEKDLDGPTNYEIKGSEYSLLTRSRFFDGLTVVNSMIYGKYESGDDKLYSLNNSKDLISGFTFMQYGLEKWFFTLSYSIEPLYPVFWGSDLKVGSIKDAGGSVNYDFNDEISLLGFFVNKMYFDGRHRKQYGTGIGYILPYLRNLKFRCGHQMTTDALDSVNSLSMEYKNEIFDTDFLANYSVETSSLHNTNLHSLDILFYRDITRYLRLNVDLLYEKERREDRDENFYARLYAAYHF